MPKAQKLCRGVSQGHWVGLLDCAGPFALKIPVRPEIVEGSADSDEN